MFSGDSLIQRATVPTLHFLVALNLLRIPYPEVRPDPTVVDNYFGTEVPDPYRWLEDLNSDETKTFVKQQQRLTDDFLKSISYREAIREKVKDTWDYPRQSVPMRVQNRYYSFKNSGLQNHSILWVQDGLEESPRVFFDPNVLSPDGSITLDSYAFSGDGQYFAYFLQEKGSDWKTIRFKDALSGRNLEDVLANTKTSAVIWSPDNQGVFYLRFPFRDKTNLAQVTLNEKIFYHRMGTKQEKDILIAEFPQSPVLRLSMQISHDHNYLVISGIESFNATSIYIAPLWEGINENFRLKIVPVFPNATGDVYRYVTNDGSTFIFYTSKDAPNYKLAAVSVNFQRGRLTGETINLWSTFVEENPHRVLDMAFPVTGDTIFLRYIKDVEHILELRSLKDGSFLHRLDLQPGSMTGFHTNGNINATTFEFFVKIESFLNPGTTYRCLLNDRLSCTVFQQRRIKNIDLTDFITELVPYPSKDGTVVTMHVVRKKGMKLDGTAPALLYGYGGFNVDTMPRFSITNLVFMNEFNGVYAQPAIRGGGEYGTKWYNAGVLKQKQNSFDDFQAAAEYLIRNKFTSPSKLTIQGGSNGGLLVAACVNQRPDLYGAAIAQNGVMDLLRFQYFTGGKLWCREYGCSDDKLQFENLIKFSPLHNIRVPRSEITQYPAVFVMTADHDDRVVPSHSYKYVAELQNTISSSSKQTRPLLLQVGTNVGHTNGKAAYKLINEISDILAFIAETLGLLPDTTHGANAREVETLRAYSKSNLPLARPNIPAIPAPGPANSPVNFPTISAPNNMQFFSAKTIRGVQGFVSTPVQPNFDNDHMKHSNYTVTLATLAL